VGVQGSNLQPVQCEGKNLRPQRKRRDSAGEVTCNLRCRVEGTRQQYQSLGVLNDAKPPAFDRAGKLARHWCEDIDRGAAPAVGLRTNFVAAVPILDSCDGVIATGNL